VRRSPLRRLNPGVVTKRHECFYRPLLATCGNQPSWSARNRGTTLAYYYALFRIAQSTQRPGGLPSVDHFISKRPVFMAHVNRLSRDAVSGLIGDALGISADSAARLFWIEPGGPVADVISSISGASATSGKSPRGQAEDFQAQGWFWNSFVMVGCASTMLELIKQAVPSVYEAFARSTRAGNTRRN